MIKPVSELQTYDVLIHPTTKRALIVTTVRQLASFPMQYEIHFQGNTQTLILREGESVEINNNLDF